MTGDEAAHSEDIQEAGEPWNPPTKDTWGPRHLELPRPDRGDFSEGMVSVPWQRQGGWGRAREAWEGRGPEVCGL